MQEGNIFLDTNRVLLIFFVHKDDSYVYLYTLDKYIKKIYLSHFVTYYECEICNMHHLAAIPQNIITA